MRIGQEIVSLSYMENVDDYDDYCCAVAVGETGTIVDRMHSPYIRYMVEWADCDEAHWVRGNQIEGR